MKPVTSALLAIASAGCALALTSVASAEVAPSTVCTDEQIDKLVQRLGEWERRFREGERRARADRHCDRAEVICLGRTGDLVEEQLPARLTAGKRFSVYVLMPSTDGA